MVDRTTSELLAIENDQRASRKASELNFGSLNTPTSNPVKIWSGVISNDEFPQFVATFRRKDNVNKRPIVDFCFDYSVDDSMKDWIDESVFRTVTTEVGSNFIKKMISISTDFWIPFANSTNMSIIVQAVSPIDGELTLERVS